MPGIGGITRKPRRQLPSLGPSDLWLGPQRWALTLLPVLKDRPQCPGQSLVLPLPG